MSDEYPDGVPHPPTPEEIVELEKQNPMLAALVKANAPKADKPAIPLTEGEQGALTAFFASKAVIDGQIEGFMESKVCARLGVHRSRILKVDLDTGGITLKD